MINFMQLLSLLTSYFLHVIHQKVPTFGVYSVEIVHSVDYNLKSAHFMGYDAWKVAIMQMMTFTFRATV